MKLVTIALYNFQSHAASSVEFGNVTTIVGNTNAGKTAIIRALKAFVDNAPPKPYVRDGANRLDVTIVYDTPEGERKIASWIKGNGENSYSLADYGHDHVDSKTFSNVGTEVPTEIESTLQMGPIRGPRDEKYYPNFRTQTDLPAIVYESEGDRLAKLVKISGIGVIQTAVRMLTKDLKSLKRDRNSLSKREEDLRSELKKYDGVEARIRSLEFVVELMSHVRAREVLYQEAKGLKEQRDVAAGLSWVDEALEVAGRSKASVALLESAVCYREAVEAIPPDVSEHKNVIFICSNKVAWYKELLSLKTLNSKVPPDTSWCAPRLSAVQEQIESFSWLAHLGRSRESIRRVGAEVGFHSKRLLALQSKLVELRGTISVCPVCGRSG